MAKIGVRLLKLSQN